MESRESTAKVRGTANDAANMVLLFKNTISCFVVSASEKLPQNSASRNSIDLGVKLCHPTMS